MKKYIIHLFFLLLIGLSFRVNAGGADKPKKKDFLITIATEHGEIKIILYDKTPNHKKKFQELVEGNYFRSSTFFKAVDNYFIQAGDQKAQTGQLREESGNPHKKGALACMATIDPNTEVKTSQITQFYIVTNPEGITFLDKNYTVFGEVIQGMEVVDKIAALDKNKDFNLSSPVKFIISGEEMKRKKITKLTGYQYPNKDEK